MMQDDIKIKDVVIPEFPDFLDFCLELGKYYISELTDMDYIAYRLNRNHTREFISDLKKHIEIKCSDYGDNNIKLIETDASNNELTNDRDCQNIDSPSVVDTVSQGLDSYSIHKLDGDIPFYQIYNIDLSKYEKINIVDYPFPTAVKNRLNAAGYFSMKDFLSLSKNELIQMKGIGGKNLDKVGIILDGLREKTIISTSNNCFDAKKYKDQILVGDFSFRELYPDDIQKTIDKYEIAYTDLGDEIISDFKNNTYMYSQICYYLKKLVIYQEKVEKNKEKIKKIYDQIPEERLNKPSCYYIKYALKSKKDNALSSHINDADITLGELMDLVDDGSTDVNELIETVYKFARFNVKQKIDDLRVRLYYNDNYKTVIIMRSQNNSLEEVGKKLNLSRERIRQIESKVKRIFEDWDRKNKILIQMSADLCGKNIIHCDELIEVYGAELQDVIYLLRNSDLGHYQYVTSTDAFLISGNDIVEIINNFVNTLPTIFLKNEIDASIQKISEECSISQSVIFDEIETRYKIDGECYHTVPLTVSYMCNHVLKTHFEMGFKAGNDSEYRLFLKYLCDVFGDAGSKMTSRALDARIGEVGCLCDRGKYVHTDYFEVSNNIIDSIEKYIDESSRNIIPYGEIFEALKNELTDSIITSRYSLQGAIKKYLPKYKTTKDSVIKNDTMTFADEVEAFVESRGTVHKSEILAEFLSLNDVSLSQVIARCENVYSIDAGYYIHTSQFDIKPEDYAFVRRYLTEVCCELPVNIRSVQDYLVSSYPEIFIRNDFDDRNKLYAALNSMFANEFKFSKPYIARKDEKDISNKTVILKLIDSFDSIEIEELVGICEGHNINIVGINQLILSLCPEYIRVSQTTLMKYELTGINDEIIEFVLENMSNSLSSEGYVAVGAIDDFIWYPNISVEWNSYLVEAIVNNSDKISTISMPGSPIKQVNTICVNNIYKNDSYTSFLIKVLLPHVHNREFPTKSEMKIWLQDNGLIGDSFPNFLESAKYFYVDSRGVNCNDDAIELHLCN